MEARAEFFVLAATACACRLRCGQLQRRAGAGQHPADEAAPHRHDRRPERRAGDRSPAERQAEQERWFAQGAAYLRYVVACH